MWLLCLLLHERPVKWTFWVVEAVKLDDFTMLEFRVRASGAVHAGTAARRGFILAHFCFLLVIVECRKNSSRKPTIAYKYLFNNFVSVFFGDYLRFCVS